MDELSATLKYNELLAIYASLLSSTQQEIMTDYYVYNLSLSEIASNRGVSRAAIEDALKKASKKLDELESKLHLLEKKNKVLKITAKLKDNADIKEDILEIERII